MESPSLSDLADIEGCSEFKWRSFEPTQQVFPVKKAIKELKKYNQSKYTKKYMATSNTTSFFGSGIDTSNFIPTLAADEALYRTWFQLADADGDGRVTGSDAVSFFQRSGLPRDQLAKIWMLADKTRQGCLDFPSFVRALELVSIAQTQGQISLDAYANQKPIGILPPRLEGLSQQMHASPRAGRDAVNAFMPSTVTGPLAATVHQPPPPPPPPLPPPQHQQGPSAMAPPPASPTGYAAPGNAFYYGGPTAAPGNIRQQTGSNAPSPRARVPGPNRRGAMTTQDVTCITHGLRKIYFNKVRPLEELFKFGNFFSPLLSEGDFEAKPSVLLLGQYSTGKTTFIKYLLGREYPGLHIGPEPTTDRFVVVMHGPDDRRTPGNTLVVQTDKPFTGLSQFGNGFLSKFEAATCENRLLEEITLVDTPGVLSGEKQRIERTYDFIQVCGWFAAQCDLILLLFDPYKLDISDEFKSVINTLRGHDDKVRVVLNKADQVDQQQLMRVYGALMWSLGKVFRSPEVCRVYIGSFNASAPMREDVNPSGKKLFEKEQEDLLHDLYEIPARSCDRKVNEFVKRVRAAKIHFLIMGHLRKQIPYFGQKKAQNRLLANLSQEFLQVQREHHLHAGDFPDVERYREILSAFDVSKFPKLTKEMIKQVDDALSIDIPQLVRSMDNPFNQ